MTRCRQRGGGLHHERLDRLHPLETLMEHKSPPYPHINATSNSTPKPAGATVSHSRGWPLAPPDRLVRALPALRRLTWAPCSSAPPTVSALFSFLGAAIYGIYAWTTLDDTCRP